MSKLATIAKTQPHAAYSALTHGLKSKWTYLCHTIPDIGCLLKPLDVALRTKLIPALKGRPPPNNLELLYPQDGEVWVPIPSDQAKWEYVASKQITLALHDHILSQNKEYGYDIFVKQSESKNNVKNQTKERLSMAVRDLMENFSDDMRRSVELALERGSSTWLTAMPLKEHGFCLHKKAFHDALALRYGWTPDRLPSKCDCGVSFSVEHTLSVLKEASLPSDTMRSVI